MTTWVRARAFANIALIKYWGKKAGGVNLPATPSISLALEALKTETVVELIRGKRDRFFVDGRKLDEIQSTRLRSFLDYWRAKRLVEGSFSISSVNDFPAASGLASSASGYAALSVALAAFSSKRLSRHRICLLARRGSGSAVRSVVGGLAAMPIGSSKIARVLLPPDQVPWGMIAVINDTAPKTVSSREGMLLCQRSSPYYHAWVKQAMADYRRMLGAIRQRDLDLIGQLAEMNALAMHACMIASRPPLLYWSAATLEVMRMVRRWRDEGRKVYFTIDAGPNVILLCHRADLARFTRLCSGLRGVQKVIPSLPGGEAKVIAWG